jgi:outer membrane lipopolysaccharide assembly protein LptE/RlpB
MQVGQSDGFAPAVVDPEKAANRVEVIREYTYDQSGVLGKEAEASIIRNEMRRELVLQIVLRTVATLASTQ